MITIRQEPDDTITIEGLTESDFLVIYMLAQTCYQQAKAKQELSEEAFNLSRLIEDFYYQQRKAKLKYLP